MRVPEKRCKALQLSRDFGGSELRSCGSASGHGMASESDFALIPAQMQRLLQGSGTVLISCVLPCLSWDASLALQADEKAAAEASARREEEQQREAERKAALKERADSYKAQEASRLQVQTPCIPMCSTLLTLARRSLYPLPEVARTMSCQVS